MARRAPTRGAAAPSEAVEEGDIEKMWVSVRAGLSAVLFGKNDSMLEGVPADYHAFAEGDLAEENVEDAVHVASKRRRTGPEASAWVAVWTDIHILFSNADVQKQMAMFKRVREYLKEFVVAQRKLLLARKDAGPVPLLRLYVYMWDRSLRAVKSMKCMLHHLHSYWIAKHRNTCMEDPVRPLDRLLLVLWREELLAKVPEVVSFLLDAIDALREGEDVGNVPIEDIIHTFFVLGSVNAPSDMDLDDFVKKLTTKPPMPPVPTGNASHPMAEEVDPMMNEALKLYLHVFENDFLKRAAVWYANEAKRFDCGGCVSSFMDDLSWRMKRELRQSEQFLHYESIPRLCAVVEKNLLRAHTSVLQEHAKEMIAEEREQDLQNVHFLLNRIGGALLPIRDVLQAHIEQEGIFLLGGRIYESTTKVSRRSNIDLVEDLINLYSRRVDMITRCFCKSDIMMQALHDGFRTFMQKKTHPISMAEVLALYVDDVMKAPLPDVGPRLYPSRDVHSLVQDVPGPVAAAAVPVDPSEAYDQIEELLKRMDELVRLFVYIDDKAAFHDKYRKLLGRRLLGDHDSELESTFISKLTKEMGQVYTSKLTGMCTDVALSTDESAHFTKVCVKAASRLPSRSNRNQVLSGISFSAFILNTQFWSEFVEDNMRVPYPLSQWERTFAEHYLRDKHSRKVKWVRSQSTNHVAAHLNGRDFVLILGTIQACALLEFNDRNKVSLGELAHNLHMQPALLYRYLRPLVSHKKSPLLLFEGDGKLVQQTLRGYDSSNEEVANDYNAARVLYPASLNALSETTGDETESRVENEGDLGGSSSVREAGDSDGVVAGPNFSGVSAETPVPANHGENIAGDGDAAQSPVDAEPADIAQPRGRDRALFPGEPTLPSPRMEFPSAIGCSRPVSRVERDKQAEAVALNGPAADNVTRSRTPDDGSSPPVKIPLDGRAPGPTLTHAGAIPEGLYSGDEDDDSAAGDSSGYEEEEYGQYHRGILDATPWYADSRYASGPSTRELKYGGQRQTIYPGSQPRFHSRSGLKEPADSAWNMYYILVPRFKSSTVRVMYPSKEERVPTRAEVASKKQAVLDRSSVLDAAIVRLMKGRMELAISNVIAELLPPMNARFEVEPRMIKERIEQLIARDLMARDPVDQNKLRYLA